jgi:hypothetical protein
MVIDVSTDCRAQKRNIAKRRIDQSALKIDLYLHQQGLDTTTPSGKAMFAELDRSLIWEME